MPKVFTFADSSCLSPSLYCLPELLQPELPQTFWALGSTWASSPGPCSYTSAQSQPRPLQPICSAMIAPTVSPCTHMSAHQQLRYPPSSQGSRTSSQFLYWPSLPSMPTATLVAVHLHAASLNTCHQPPLLCMHLWLPRQPHEYMLIAKVIQLQDNSLGIQSCSVPIVGPDPGTDHYTCTLSLSLPPHGHLHQPPQYMYATTSSHHYLPCSLITWTRGDTESFNGPCSHHGPSTILITMGHTVIDVAGPRCLSQQDTSGPEPILPHKHGILHH